MIIQGIKLTGTTVIAPDDSVFVTGGLVLHFDPSNISSYSGSGTTINDLSGNGLTGTMSNITYTSPYFSYNGTSSRITVADNALLEPGSGDWTIEAWAYIGSSGNFQTILGKFPSGSNGYWLRTVTGVDLYGYFGDGASILTYNSPGTVLALNTWKHVVYVWKNVSTKTLEVFINGVSSGSTSHSLSGISNTSNPLTIGGNFTSTVINPWNGRIGIVRLYNTALSSADVLTNYNGSKAIYGL